MTRSPYRTAIIGFGKVGAEYADDPIMARHYPVATHAQALKEHPSFDWCAVVDPRLESRNSARDRWGVTSVFSTVEELARSKSIEVAVLATPPEARLEVIESLPNLRAVIVEKPLGTTLADAQMFVRACTERGIRIQVNYWRRADDCFRHLAQGELTEIVGTPQAVFGIYGNGLRNNGSHMIDFGRMLFGELASAEAVGSVVRHRTAPIRGDVDVPFRLIFKTGLCAMFQPVDFERYRENSLDIWGTEGRLQIVQEGLALVISPRVDHRATQGAHEIVSDRPITRTTSVGIAFRRLYDHTADMLANNADPVSSPDSALKTEAAVEAIFDSIPRIRSR